MRSSLLSQGVCRIDDGGHEASDNKPPRWAWGLCDGARVLPMTDRLRVSSVDQLPGQTYGQVGQPASGRVLHGGGFCRLGPLMSASLALDAHRGQRSSSSARVAQASASLEGGREGLGFVGGSGRRRLSSIPKLDAPSMPNQHLAPSTLLG
ncbi:hypothetical protein AXG93_203s1210 [Marchantia polymorpha subsp. ruderalis]|uniref:Uncharacterized protein n=1 Tax=Marchantia polymorpha subsp. ruderalis TaxID=1480154 RepID=A0A176VJQ2_MARPO|nr:hypothetical protein AXG93_203s1210 [Marchantia polymorpha subsp. ruderalis]